MLPTQVVVFAQAPTFSDATRAIALWDADPDLVLHLAFDRDEGATTRDFSPNAIKLFIGALNLNGVPQANTYFEGRIDDFRVYRRVLRPDEARALYTTGPLVDRDLDGLPDDWEWAMFGSLARDGWDDFDRDGMADYGEWIAGTDPTVPEDVLRVVGTYGGTGDPPFLFGWPSVSGRFYSVLAATNLSEHWQPAQHPPFAGVLGYGGPMSYTSGAPFAAGRYFTIGVRTNPAPSD